MRDGAYPVEWLGHQAIVALPDYLDASNAVPAGEELLAVISRGAGVLIVDMTATASCDQAGADAMVRAWRRAIGNGTQLRLVAPAPIVRRVLAVNGLDQLVSVYPSREAAIAAGHLPVEAAAAAWQEQSGQELLGKTVESLFHVALGLQAVLDAAPEAGRERISGALQRLDGTIREIRGHLFTVRSRVIQHSPGPRPARDH